VAAGSILSITRMFSLLVSIWAYRKQSHFVGRCCEIPDPSWRIQHAASIYNVHVSILGQRAAADNPQSFAIKSSPNGAQYTASGAPYARKLIEDLPCAS
jgi:hypothetical protein